MNERLDDVLRAWDDVLREAMQKHPHPPRGVSGFQMNNWRVAQLVIERNQRIANLESLLPQAFDAGTAYGIASHRDFMQVHPDRDAWVREALGRDEETR